MKKGATPAQIFGIMYDLVEMGFIVKNDQDFKNIVIKKYNEIYLASLLTFLILVTSNNLYYNEKSS